MFMLKIRMFQKILLLHFVTAVSSLLCYNCSSSKSDFGHCGGNFVEPSLTFNSSRFNLINCTKENSMCFVRSWVARDRHAWIVQRGCYHVGSEDTMPKAMNTPTRAMTCKLERLANAEYKTCLCNADWCNSASLYKNTNILPKLIYLIHLYTCIGIL